MDGEKKGRRRRIKRPESPGLWGLFELVLSLFEKSWKSKHPLLDEFWPPESQSLESVERTESKTRSISQWSSQWSFQEEVNERHDEQRDEVIILGP